MDKQQWKKMGNICITVIPTSIIRNISSKEITFGRQPVTTTYCCMSSCLLLPKHRRCGLRPSTARQPEVSACRSRQWTTGVARHLSTGTPSLHQTNSDRYTCTVLRVISQSLFSAMGTDGWSSST